MVENSESSNEMKRMTDILVKRYEVAENFSKTAKQYPRPRKDKLNATTRYEFMMYESNNVKPSNKDQLKTRFNFITTHEHFCSKKLENLEPITLQEMQVNKIHTGRFLLCRTVQDPFYVTSMMSLVEDSNDEMENLSLYNFNNYYELDPKLILPKGSILIIKEPYLKSMLSSQEDYHIRVESPSDIIIISDLDYEEKYSKYLLDKWTSNASESEFTFDELNKKGNRLFVEQNYHQAIRYYTKALNLAAKKALDVKNSDLKKTLNNRAAAYLKLEKFNHAYLDTVRSSEIESAADDSDLVYNEKAYFRMGKAAYSMRQFETALNAFEKCLGMNFKNKEANDGMQKTKQRLSETLTGKYDVKSVIEQAFVQKQPLLDVADYISPDIEVVNLNNDTNYKGKLFFNKFLFYTARANFDYF
jgi:tetratricopeptide (TPR) repeat protein